MRQLTRVLFLVCAVTALAAPSGAQAPASDPLALVKDGRKLHAAGRFDEALALYRKALEVDPKLYEAHLAAGITLDLVGQYQTARVHLERAIELAPEESRAQALSAMAVSYAFECDTERAATFYQRQFDLQQTAGRLDAAAATANALGRVYLECGDLDKAREWYQTGYETAKKVAGMPTDQAALWEMRWLHAQARIAARRKDAAQAEALAEKIRAMLEKGELDADQKPIYQYLVGYNALYTGRYDQAIEALKAADQNDPFIIGLLARAFEGAGRQDEAREAWKRAYASTAHNLQNAFTRPTARKKVGPAA